MDSSFLVKIRKDYVRKSDGYGRIYLYVRLEKEKERIDLALFWPPNLLDEKAQKLLPRQKDDKLCDDFNVAIQKEIAKAYDILIEARLGSCELTMKEFLAKFKDYEKQKDFIAFMEAKIRDRYRRDKISLGTKNSHENSLRWLKSFRPILIYRDFSPKLIESFEAFLKKQLNRRANDNKKLDGNTIVNITKYVRAYINLAIRDGIPIENPFKKSDIKTTQDQKEKDFLMPSDVKTLMNYAKDELPLGERVTLLRYLITCCLGLRISDVMKLNELTVQEFVQKKSVAFSPTKQQKSKAKKMVYIPIDGISQGYLEKLILSQNEARAKGLKISEPYGRKVLRKIGEKLKINITGFHQGRHTFATNYLRAGGKIQNLQQILGHSNIATTLIYLHIVEDDKEAEMLALSNFYQAS